MDEPPGAKSTAPAGNPDLAKMLRYRVPMASTGEADRAKDAAAKAEAVRIRRLREDAQRSISVNLAETIALSHALLKMADAARRR